MLLAVPIAAGVEPTADELAGLAAEVHQQHCADIYGGDIDLAAEGYSAVAPVWQQVNEVYAEEEQSFLLYWRGLLAQCLGQVEQCVADLEGFVEAEGETGNLEAMVRDANRRLRRLRFQQDEGEAREELGRYEFRRYRRSGVPLNDWRLRRHSMGQRLVLLLGVGLLHGANRATHVQAVTSDGDWVAADWLDSDSYLNVRLGFEAWPGEVLGIGVVAEVAGGEVAYTALTVEDLAGASVTTNEDGAKSNGWIGGSVWVVTTPLPRKPFKPLFRLGPRFRFTADRMVGDHDIRSEAWSMASLGMFAGVAYHPRTVVGVEIGVWFVGDLTSGSKVSGDTEIAASEWTNMGDEHSGTSLELVFQLRFGL